MDDFDEYYGPSDRLSDIESQILIIRGLVEKTEREVRHIGIVLGIGVALLAYLLLR